MNLSEIFVLPILHILIGFVFGIILTFVKSKLPSKLRWNLRDYADTKFIIATSISIKTNTYIKQATGLGQVYAIGRLLSSFFKAYSAKKDPQIYFSENTNENDLKSNLVVIGGVKHNSISKSILEKCPNLPYTQVTQDNIDIIIDRRRHQSIYGLLEEGVLKDDFGLIISIPNPYNPDRRALIFLSVHTFGLDAAAEVFTKELTMGKNLFNKNYVCLVKCKVESKNITEPEILDFVKLKNGQWK